MLVLGACRIGFDTLAADTGDGGGGGDGSIVRPDSVELGTFSAPMQHTALGVVGRGDQHPTLTADLLEIYFSSNRGCASCYDIFVAKRATVTSPWSTPAELTELTNAAADMTPEISADGLTLWYASERQSPAGGADIWFTTRADRSQSWAPPMRETALSTAGYDCDPALSTDGLRMTMTSDGSGSIAADLFVATRATPASPWSTPVPIAELNTPAYESAGSLRDNQRQQFFDRETTPGQYDIYMARREATAMSFDTPSLVSGINSPQSDLDPWVSQDLRTFFFSSARTGDMEIFEATR